MKKITLSLMAMAIAVSAFAYDLAVEGQQYWGSNCAAYGLADGTVAVTTYYLPTDYTEIWIPTALEVWEGDVKTAEYEVSQVGYDTWGALYVEQNGAQANNLVTAIHIAEGVKFINTSAFATWQYDGVVEATQFLALASVELPSTLTTIGDYGFHGADALRSIKCDAATAPAIGADGFKGISAWDAIAKQCVVYVPSEAAKETYNQQGGDNGLAWSYWGEFYKNGNVIVNSGSATSITEVELTTKARKVIRNGQILIERNGVFYNLTGAVAE